MGKSLFSASKTLGDPSALRPQGDKKRGLRATWWGSWYVEGVRIERRV